MLNLDESAPVPNRHEQIIDALRSEMQEYGGLLNLFDRQQNAILNRKPDEVADSDQAIGVRGQRSDEVFPLQAPRTNRR